MNTCIPHPPSPGYSAVGRTLSSRTCSFVTCSRSRSALDHNRDGCGWRHALELTGRGQLIGVGVRLNRKATGFKPPRLQANRIHRSGPIRYSMVRITQTASSSMVGDPKPPPLSVGVLATKVVNPAGDPTELASTARRATRIGSKLSLKRWKEVISQSHQNQEPYCNVRGDRFH